MISPIKSDLRWYANVDGKNFGPCGRSDIERMIQNRQLLATDYLCIVGGGEWIEARNEPTFGRLFSSRVNATAVPPDRPADVSAGGAKIYCGKSSTQWRIGIVSFVFGLAGLVPLKHIFSWLSGGPRPASGEFIAVGVLLLLPAGIVFVVNALRGLPRLAVTPKGLKFENGIRTRQASWDSVGPFSIIIYPAGFRRIRMASAKIVGASVSRVRTFAIPDQFTTPIDTIAAELNAARAKATGGATPTSEPVAKEAPIGLEQFRLPWLTFALMAVLTVVFTLENMYPVTPTGRGLTPSIATLLAFGASSYDRIINHGEWYRLFTAPLLHGNLAHIVGNGIALVWGGWLLERLVGRLWFFAFFAVGALGGSLISLAVNPVNLVSVGASGALMGLFAALFVGGFRHESGTPGRMRLQFSSMRILIPSLLPIASTSAVARIDYGAHIGGTLSGAALAFLLLKNWPENARIPQLRKVAVATSAVGALLFVASGSLMLASYPKWVQSLAIAPIQLHVAQCENKGGTFSPATVTNGCTVAIESGRLSSPELVKAYDYRGVGFADKGDLDRAIADFTEAITLDPKNAAAYFIRGRLELLTGVLPNALADLNQANELNPKDPYAALWRDIASKRSGLPSQLPEAIKLIDMTKWPAPVIRLYLGQLTPEAVSAAADDSNAEAKRTQVCELNFYTGELALQDGKKDEAKRLLGLAAAGCPKSFMEYQGTAAELKVLGATP